MSGDEDRIAELVATALARLEAGEPARLDELCHAHPEDLPEIQAALGLRDALSDLRERNLKPDAKGRLLAGRYRLVEVLGSGAAGTVWRSHDQQLQREVAVKLLHRSLFAGPESEQRFHQEAVVLAGHEHEHIVRIYDHGRADDDTPFLVTELLRGASLAQILAAAQQAMPNGPSLAQFAQIDWLRSLLEDERPDPSAGGAPLESTWLRQSVRWVLQLGVGLAAAHADGICHRDVKPGNAFVRTNGTAVLLDFGIASKSGDAGLTATHAVLGTPSYMAPEQAAGDLQPHPALDIYGLTATLYHLLTLRPPHQGDLQQVLVALTRDEPMPAERLCRGLPRDLQAILDKGSHRQPSRRYASMQAMCDDLRSFLDHRPVAARPVGSVARAMRRARRRPARTLAVAATVAALGFAAFGLPAIWSLQANAQESAHHEGLRRIPADICIEGWPDMRPLVPIDQQLELVAELDALIEHDPRDVGLRLLRAASCLDFGHVERARRDLDQIAANHSSAYVTALAICYRDAKPGERGRGVLDLSDLPEPEEEVDFFLAGFHALRARDCKLADVLLSRAESYLPARDLRLLAILGKRRADPQRAIKEASLLEGIYGYQTARTQHTLAVAHLQQQLFEQAIPYCQRSLEIRPDRHGPWTNLGFANLRLGRLLEARRCYQRAVELRSWLPNSLSGLSQTLRELGERDAARAVAGQIRDVGWREYELGSLELDRAFDALHQDDRDAMAEAAELAQQHFGRSANEANTTNPKRGQVKAQTMLASMLAEDDRRTALVPLLFGMRKDPANPRHIANLSKVLGEYPPNADALGRLRLWLLDLAVSIAKENPAYQRMRAALLQDMQARRNR